MLTTLIESKRIRSRNRGATAVSVVVHAVVIVLVAAVTAHASDRTPTDPPKVRDVIYIAPSVQDDRHEDRSTVRPTEPPREPRIPRFPFRTIDIPKTIPTGIPPADPSLPPIDLDQFAIGSNSSSAGRGSYGSTSGDDSDAYTAWQVEKAVVALEGNPKPVYPSVLQAAHVEGEVLAQFVVDTTGYVDMSTFRAIRSTDELFVQAVRRALAKWRFLPAEIAGVKVKQLVQMPLIFRMR